MRITEYVKDRILYLDGAMGTMLQNKGLKAGECSEKWNITAPDIVTEIHRAYYDAGSNVVSTNTFGVNTLKYSEEECRSFIESAILNAENARKLSSGKQEKYIAFDIGPLGKLLKPFGEISFEEAVEIFTKTVKIACEFEFDLFIIETLTDIYETKAALLAVKENSDLPVFVTNAYGEDLRLMSGADAELTADLITSMGADAVGVNCSFGPDMSIDIVKSMCKSTCLPVILKPNAGMPEFIEERTVYNMSPDEFADSVSKACEFGVNIVGGCCGTTPEYIKALVRKTSGLVPVKINIVEKTIVSSFSKTVSFENKPVLIGERINPTGKKRFKQALLENDIDYIVNEGIMQENKGVHILDVNVGLAGIDEKSMLEMAVKSLQTVTSLPLQIDSSSPEALEAALRIYNGKALINSVNGKKESMDAVFPLVKKYGGVVIALTLDENGIPETVEGRINVARKILAEAEKYNISKKDIIFDPLALSVSTDAKSADITISTVEKIRNMLNCKTSLGVSNISFGLPDREKINSTFFACALNKGLNAAIINPFSEKMLDAYYSYCALSGTDENFSCYIDYCNKNVNNDNKRATVFDSDTLKTSIISGRKEKAASITAELIKSCNSLDVINEHIIPALNEVGERYEKGIVYLPQLLMSAETAASAFEVIKRNTKNKQQLKCDVVIATVKGDIHDIGKNIVKLLLENFGFNVIDLGKDVAPEIILDTVMKKEIRLVGLSALMTTTLSAMKETVELIKNNCKDCYVFVGGAVVNDEFALSAGADKYCPDALSSVKFCDRIFSEITA